MAEKMQGKFTSEFKAQVALAAISNQMTVSEIVEKYNVSKTMVYQWKEEFLSNASKVFESDRTTRQQEKQIDNLHRKIGELEMELDFAKRALKATLDAPLRAPQELVPFTGKERDSETGYSYFGARYYDSDLSGLFLSVDPMSDKYPSINPYAYCAWNPLRLVDPDGEEIGDYYTISGQYLGWDGKDDGNIYFVNDKESIRRFSKGKKVSSDDIKVAFSTTKKELQESINTYNRSLEPSNMGRFEEGAIVNGDNVIEAERGTPNSIILPQIPDDWDKDKVTSIHLHIWQLDTEKNNYHMAISMGPCDEEGFEKYQKNIIVGNVPGPIDGPKTVSGITKPTIGVALYGRGTGSFKPSVVLSMDLVKKIIKRKH